MSVAHPFGVVKVFQIVAVQQTTGVSPQPVFRERRILFIQPSRVKEKSLPDPQPRPIPRIPSNPW
jgi:hypothetical protein